MISSVQYGREVTVHCNHKPISSNIKKPLSACPLRLSRMLLAMSKISSQGHTHSRQISDCLSQQSIPDTCPKIIKGLDVHNVKKQLFVTDQQLEKIRSEIQNDYQCSTLKRTIIQGWPEKRSNCPKLILEFFNHRDELSFEDDLIFRGHTLKIPRSMRSELIEKVHSAYLGITKTLMRAKDSML